MVFIHRAMQGNGVDVDSFGPAPELRLHPTRELVDEPVTMSVLARGLLTS